MTLVEELRQAGDSWRRRHEGVHGTLGDKAAVEIERLQAALKKYGYHKRGCHTQDRRVERQPCDCGWGDIEKTLQE